MDKPYYKINEYFLYGIGQWPGQSKFAQILISLVLLLDMSSLLLVEILALMKAWGKTDDVINCLPIIMLNLAGLTYLIVSWSNKKKLEILLSKLKNSWSIWTTGPEYKILQDYATQGRKYTVLYSILITINLSDYLTVPLLTPLIMDTILPLNESRPRRHIIDSEYIIMDREKYFYLVEFHTSITTMIIMFVVVSIDAVFFIVLYHTCGELTILGLKFKNLTELNNNMLHNKLHEEIRFCAQKHKSIILFVNEITEYFSTLCFIILGFNMLMISVTGVQIVANLHKPHDAYRYAVFVIGQIFHLFWVTIPCQYLINHSIDLLENMYKISWYEMPLKSQKLLLTMMMRCIRPCSFTAGGLYTYSLESFTTVLKTSMSYYTVLLSVRD